MDDDVRFDLGHQVENALPITNIDIVMFIARDILAQTLQRPSCVAFGSKENGSLVVVDTVNLESGLTKMDTDFRPNQATRTGHQRFLTHLYHCETGTLVPTIMAKR